MPGKLYDFNTALGVVDQQQFADMSNGVYYMVTRINTNSILWGHSEDVVLRKIDSVIYENVPGKIITKQPITRNGYKGYEVTNRTRRGDFQRYNIFVTPFEVILFKMSGNDDYVKEGTEANQFFSSIQFSDYKAGWKKWAPSFGGFEVDLPHEAVTIKKASWQFMAVDKPTNTGFEVVRTDVHNYGFVEEDSFDLNLMEESFGASDFVDKQISRKQVKVDGYSALDAKYKYKDGSVALVRFLVQGPHYYTLVTHSKTENARMSEFLNSFAITPFRYQATKELKDTSLAFTVSSPVPIEKQRKLSLYPDKMPKSSSDEDEDFSEENTTANKMVVDDSTGEKIFLYTVKPSRYYFDKDTSWGLSPSYFERGKMKWQLRSSRKYQLPNSTKVYEYVVGDPASSRYIRGKILSRNGAKYWLQTEGDTISKPSAFVTRFFDSFAPFDNVKSSNPSERKSKLFFEDFFSKDSLLHKRAVANVSKLDFDSTDFPQLKKSIQSLSWKDKKYVDTKNNFLGRLADVKSKEAADYLKDVYYSAGDTIEFQYSALNALLNQKTAYAYRVFRDIMVKEPPILYTDDADASSYRRTGNRSRSSFSDMNYVTTGSNTNDSYRNQNFMDDLSDTVQLTATIFKDLLPLMDIRDYEQPMMEIATKIIDSNLISANDYRAYMSRFLAQAKQALKKQLILERNVSIEKAKLDDAEEASNYSNKDDDGNTELITYATLLMPFVDENASVKQFINQLLNSDDRRLKYNTFVLLLRNHKTVPDTLVNYFAAQDDYRYELYSDLKDMKLESLFPSNYNNPVQLAKSNLYYITSDYTRPDSLVYLDRMPVRFKDRKGFVYFFKYKGKRDDNTWKLASVGIVPGDGNKFEFDDNPRNYWQRRQYNFTEFSSTRITTDTPVKDQLNKALKKMSYSRRNSAVQFYTNEDKLGGDYYPAFSVGN
jgi:hypothetical protein